MQNAGGTRLMKIPVDGGTPVVVRSDNARGPAPAPDGSALYYMVPLQNLNGSLDYVGDVDWYRFSARTGQMYTITLVGTQGAASVLADPLLRVLGNRRTSPPLHSDLEDRGRPWQRGQVSTR